MKQKKKKSFSKSWNINSANTCHIRVYTGLKHTFEPRAGDNLWLNISRLVWLHVLNF